MNFGLVKSDQNFGHFGRKWVNILLYCCIFAHTFSLLKGSQFFLYQLCLLILRRLTGGIIFFYLRIGCETFDFQDFFNRCIFQRFLRYFLT